MQSIATSSVRCGRGRRLSSDVRPARGTSVKSNDIINVKCSSRSKVSKCISKYLGYHAKTADTILYGSL